MKSARSNSEKQNSEKQNFGKQNLSKQNSGNQTDRRALPPKHGDVSEQTADWEWLLSLEGESVLQTLQKQKIADELKRVTFLREKLGLTPRRAALVAEQANLRGRGREKFGDRAEMMFFTPVGLEQSTDRWIAEYKARRFPANLPLVDVCCGIGGDLMAYGAERNVLGVDLNPITAMIARANLRLISSERDGLNEGGEFGKRGESERVDLKMTDSEIVSISAEEFATRYLPEAFPCLHIDPDRRGEGVRVSQMTWFEPGQETVESLLAGRRYAAVKLAPGTKVPPSWLLKASELEWIGRNRECRQLVVWFCGVSNSASLQYRATLIEAHSSKVLGTFSGESGFPVEASEVPGRFVFDPDPSILAADLTGALARRRQLKGLGPGSLYLTGDVPIVDDPFLSCFEIIQILPLDRKQITRAVREQEWSQIEIKKRGAVPEPETVRSWLRFPKKGKKGVLILAQFSDRTCAILANRIKSE